MNDDIVICPWSTKCSKEKKKSHSHCDPHEKNVGCSGPRCDENEVGACIIVNSNANMSRIL